MRSVIVSGGTAPSKELLLKYIKSDDFIIGVDKGCDALYKYNIKPNIVLGDFDSASSEVVEYFKKEIEDFRKYKPEKDYTDTDLGYITAKENGATEILLFGATGTRLDHMFGNIGIMLKALRENIDLKIIDNYNITYLIDKKTTFSGKFGEEISFHAISDVVKNVEIKGAKYELHSYDMTLFEPRAICNQFIDSDITISFDSGIIMVDYPKVD